MGTGFFLPAANRPLTSVAHAQGIRVYTVHVQGRSLIH